MSYNTNEENEIIIGIVTGIIYKNSSNGYAVCDVEAQDSTLTVVGCLPDISEGDSIKAYGQWTIHQDYGPQFKADYYEKTMPTEISDILKYLSSGIIKGVKRATAQKIVDMFGTDTINVLETCPERLAKIRGISKERALQIGNDFITQQMLRNVVVFFQRYGIPSSYAVKLYNRYGDNTINTIKENPYILFERIHSIGFKTADRVANEMGIPKNADIRIRAGIIHNLIYATLSGHTFMPREILIKESVDFLDVEYDEVDTNITSMIFDNILKSDLYDNTQRIYLKNMYEAEGYVADKLFLNSNNKRDDTSAKKIDDVIGIIERENSIKLAQHQRSAVHCAVKNGVTVITGGPGTGKTTIINTIIRVMEIMNKNVVLAAPTGRAAKRMTEVCSKEAKTIHRLLEVMYTDDENARFERNEDNPLDCDMVIIDEMSMVDITLISSLLKAVKKTTSIVFVGDVDQLPSVGPGNVLKDIISSGVVPVVSLTEIFRQAKESKIVVNAHRINNGEYPLSNEEGTDFFFVKRENADDISNSIVDLYINRLPNAYGFDAVNMIQVLSPTRKGIAGVKELNNVLQNAVNPYKLNKNEKKYKNILFREGDKVMQTKNNYDMEWRSINNDKQVGYGVFNGDIGYINKIDNNIELAEIIFDDRVYEYSFSEMEELDLAYAVTVHKSQGSEFDVVIIPMYPCAPMLQNRNLLYTAVTRAKKMVVLVGRDSSIKKMVDNDYEQKRYSGLCDKLSKVRL